MNRYILLSLLILLFLSCFLWGLKNNNKYIKTECEKETVVEEREVIKYVFKEKSDIYSKPNANRNELLKLMSENNL